MVRVYDIKQKEIINEIDGGRLGYISDVEIDMENGKILKIIVPGKAKFLGIFGRDMEYQIPWEKIKKIGEDIILVEIDVEKHLIQSDY